MSLTNITHLFSLQHLYFYNVKIYHYDSYSTYEFFFLKYVWVYKVLKKKNKLVFEFILYNFSILKTTSLTNIIFFVFLVTYLSGCLKYKRTVLQFYYYFIFVCMFLLCDAWGPSTLKNLYAWWLTRRCQRIKKLNKIEIRKEMY